MSQDKLDKIFERINDLQTQLEQEFDRLFTEKQEQFHYNFERGKVIFEEGIRELHDRYRTDIWEYLRNARLGHILIAPIIYSIIFPLLLLCVFWSFRSLIPVLSDHLTIPARRTS